MGIRRRSICWEYAYTRRPLYVLSNSKCFFFNYTYSRETLGTVRIYDARSNVGKGLLAHYLITEQELLIDKVDYQ